MDFRTKTEIKPINGPIGYGHSGLSVGSCFADNIAARLRNAKFKITNNPFGVLYNPYSVADCIERLAANRPFTKAELVRNGELWCSLSAHGSFSSPSPGATLDNLNKALSDGAEALAKAGYIIITFGTSWIYELKNDFEAENAEGGHFTANTTVCGRDECGSINTGMVCGAEKTAEKNTTAPARRIVAANCHKFPQAAFHRRRMTADEIVSRYRELFNGILSGKRIILTVSPVRHLKDGLHGNNLSKAVLLLAVETLAAEFPDVYYFPSYEIVADELRDYRFYEPDMAHPSQTAIDYIWELFRESVLSEEARRAVPEMEKVTAAASHRPFNPETESYREFLASALDKAKALQSRFPDADLGDDIDFFTRRLACLNTTEQTREK